MIGLIGAVLIGAAIGWVAERYQFTRMGLVPAMTMAVGGACLAYLVLVLFGIGIYGKGITSAIGAVLALLVVPRLRGS